MTIHHGDCLEVMATLPAASVDAVVTDPPYAFPGGFMSKSWDRFTGEDVDPAFLHWFAGFVDGEGCFSVHKKPQDTYDCQFSISLRADDRPILERIHRTLGMGTLSSKDAHRSEGQHPQTRFVVSSKTDCLRLRDLFRDFPLRAKKAVDFEEWSAALDAWVTHQTGEWEDMAEARNRLMKGRAFKPEGVRVDPYQLWTIRWARLAFRALKPGGWLIAAGAPKRVHRMTCGLEDAGFEIRDMILHCFASGFPKGRANLKPAYEPWVLARKPGPLRELAIDACRIPSGDERVPVFENLGRDSHGIYGDGLQGSRQLGQQANYGRWPANIVLTDPIFDGGWEGVVGGGEASYNKPGVFGQQRGDQPVDTAAPFAVRRDGDGIFGYGDSGTYSRFFIIPKADRADREPVLGGLPLRQAGSLDGRHGGTKADPDSARLGGPIPQRANVHPTVKPTDLMRHLVRLVTPTGGVCLDPFLGSGTTAIACELEGFEWIGIEREAEYVAIAEARLNGTQRGLGLGA